MGKLELISDTDKVSMYSPKYDNETDNEFRKFLNANRYHKHPQLIKSFDTILAIIEKISDTTVEERYFRPEVGNVKAIPIFINQTPKLDKTIGKMRLYCLRLSDRILILGNGVVTTANVNQDDPVILGFIKDLRDIERHIRTIVKQANTNYEDYYALKQIIETITI